MLYRCFFALALLGSFLSAQPPRTEADAQALESRLESSPSDLTTRVFLLYYYSRTRPASVTAESVRPFRRKHILWMIENHPEHPTMGEMPGIIDKSGTPLADPEGWAEADLAWKRITADAKRPEIWANAIAFYRTADPAFAIDLAERGLVAFPHNSAIEGAKGTVLAYRMMSIHEIDQYGRATSFDDNLAKSSDAAAARKELESTSEAALAGNAAMTLNDQQYSLMSRQRTKEAADLVAFVQHLNERAVELDPTNQRWKTQLASSFWTQSSAKPDPTEKIALLEKAVLLADHNLSLYVLPALATAYFDAGNLDKAAETANDLLERAARDKDKPASSNGNYGGAVHTGNIVLGRIDLKRNNIEGAKSHLLAAGRTTWTPALSSFGPNWNLAQDLLAKGERDTVLSYIDLCRAFWTSGKSRLDSWDTTIRAGGSPNFFAPLDMSRTQLVGKAAPDFRLKKLGGGEISLAEFKGKVVLLDFWATWCGPCRAEMPEFEKLHQELSSKDVVILALDFNEPQETVAEYIKKEKYTFPVLLSEGTDVVSNRYGIHTFPTTLAIDKTGRVADEVVGYGTNSGSRLRAAIDKARNGAPPPPPDTPSSAPPPAAVTPSVPPAITAEDFYRDGYRLRVARDLTGALAAFDRAVALRKDWLPAVIDRANCLYQLKRYDEAIAALTEAIRLDPKRAPSYNERGLAYSNSLRHAEAIPDYTHAIELLPSSGAYNNRGWAHLELGHLDEALADLDKALDIGPSNEVALGNRVRVFIAQKQYARALDDCNAALRQNPKSTWAVSRKTEVQRMMGVAVTTLPAPRLLSPAPGTVFDHYPRQTTVVWAEVPGAVNYRVEWAYESTGTWSDPTPIISVKEPVANFQFVGAQPGRWRVWAVDASGQEGAKSDWREFRYTR
jgi:tetratricopeptide (TPR) repeat protein/thiol-disulfide isomerase/thioredoxin